MIVVCPSDVVLRQAEETYTLEDVRKAYVSRHKNGVTECTKKLYGQWEKGYISGTRDTAKNILQEIYNRVG